MKEHDLCLRPVGEGGAFKVCGDQDCIDMKRWGDDSVTGPDGGYGSGWKCGKCATDYYFNDK